MTTKKLLIITEGGKEIGFGHITRTISLSTQFLNFGYQLHFIINGDNSLDTTMKPYSYEIYNWQDETQRLEKNVKDCQLILLDSMKISNNQIKQLEILNIPIIFIDDEKQRNILESGFVVDWTIFRDNDNSFVPKKANVIYLLGSLFTPLRPEFVDASQNPINQNVSKIMITFCGSDVRNLTPFILEMLNTNFPNIAKDVIIGGGFKNLKEIEKHTTQNTNLIYNATANEMIQAMKTSDIAIAAGGQTLYELAKIGIPTIGILLVENAKDDTLGWSKTGFLKYVGTFDTPSLKEDIIGAIDSLFSYESRIKMRKDGSQYISQNGAKLLVGEIMKGLDGTF
jgi:UDP-2,4-diacetamido-2,4,6-trideoxy-beta-L-altropyranose hydrolase